MDKILLLEDDFALGELLTLSLTSAGYRVIHNSTINEAKKSLNSSISIVILDLNLPDGDGREIIPSCEELGIPVLILSARNSVIDKISGLNQGADDYMEKPFDTIELLARLKAILRRYRPKDVITIDSAVIDISKKSLRVNKSEESLTSTEWQLLEFLIKNRGYIVSRDTLLDKVWGWDYSGNTRTVDVHIQKLRQKLKTEKITTLYKQGYRLEN